MAKKLIQLATDLKLDESAATQTFGIVARKEGGKTYLASKLVEELYRVQCPVVVMDPVGNWWGLTVAANGKDPGLAFVVLGGERGDIELFPEGGAIVAELVINRNLNVVLDVSSFSKTNMRRFVADFCERFFELSKRRRQARMVVFEEAQRFAPQQHKGQERMLGTVEDIVRLGRNYGLGCMLISQRPQSVNKEVLSQVECLFVGQINESHARKALLAWIVEKGEDLKSRLDELTSLERGQFFCWSPSWLRIFRKVRILPKWTFDGSSTPKIGEASSQVGPPLGRLSTVELAALKAAMQPKSNTLPSAVEAGTKAAREALHQEQALRKESEQEAARLLQLLRVQVAELQGSMRATANQLNEIVEGLMASTTALPIMKTTAKPVAREPSRPEKPPVETSVVKGSDAQALSLGKCSRAVLTVLVQQRKALSKRTLALMAGYRVSGGFNNTLSELRIKGYLQGRGMLEATALGVNELGFVPPLPTGSDLFEYWLKHPRLDKCSRAIFSALRHSKGLTKAELAEITGYAISGGFNNSLSRLRTLGLLDGHGTLYLAAHLR